MFCQCDKCGNRIRIDGATLGKPPASHHWRQVGKPFETSLDAPWLDNQPSGIQAEYDEYERRQPARAASVESDVYVPAFQSLLWGAASLPLTIPLTLVTGWPLWVAPAMSCAVISVSWASSMARHSQLLWLIEHVVKRDVNGDGQVGKPEEPQVPIEINHAHSYGYHRQRGNLPKGVTEEAFYKLVRGILSGKPITQEEWTPLRRGKPFSKPKFEAVCDYLFKAGCLEWIDEDSHSAGRRLAEKGGEQALRDLLRPPPPPDYHTRK